MVFSSLPDSFPMSSLFELLWQNGVKCTLRLVICKFDICDDLRYKLLRDNGLEITEIETNKFNLRCLT